MHRDCVEAWASATCLIDSTVYSHTPLRASKALTEVDVIDGCQHAYARMPWQDDSPALLLSHRRVPGSTAACPAETLTTAAGQA